MAHPAPRRRNLVIAAVSLLIAGLALAGCSGAESASAPQTARDGAGGGGLLADHELDDLDTPEVIERLDSMPVDDRPSDLLASVRPDALVLSDEQQRAVELPMPDDQVYVSVAPYRQRTHECHFHSLTTCEGELGNAAVRVVLTGPGGDVLLVDETRETFDNGFVGLWVPRDIEATLTIAHEGRTGTARIATGSDDDPTCITNLRLT
ncbi:hypothetical protein LY13_004827 [Prauserella aidingensis]|uniref:CueP family metal-binding protein n=1 Tax=Prauserella aidingensis TaxID=387890 RepID=UPI0020A36D13|nr:CueP family metal-binding protein [Prauserella aidingensis]MCP2256044.1 hypothetical protein [Prauserella aidingensis]